MSRSSGTAKPPGTAGGAPEAGHIEADRWQVYRVRWDLHASRASRSTRLSIVGRRCGPCIVITAAAAARTSVQRLLARAAQDRDRGRRTLEAALGDPDDLDGAAERGVQVGTEAGALRAEPDVAVDHDHARRGGERGQRREDVRQLSAVELPRLVGCRCPRGSRDRLDRGRRVRPVAEPDAGGDYLGGAIVDIDTDDHGSDQRSTGPRLAGRACHGYPRRK